MNGIKKEDKEDQEKNIETDVSLVKDKSKENGIIKIINFRINFLMLFH